MKPRQRIFLFPLVASCFLFLVFCSCSKSKVKTPEGVLSQKEMIPILVDVHIAQAAAGLHNEADTARFTLNDYLPYILKTHHVEKIVYDSSISFYTLHPEIMQEMYDEVINELSKKQGEAQKK